MLPLGLPLGSIEWTVVVLGNWIEETEEGTVDSADPIGTDAAGAQVVACRLLPFPANVAVVVAADGVLAGCSGGGTDEVELVVKAKPPPCVLLLAPTFALLNWLSSDPTNADTASASADGFEIKSSRKLDAIFCSEPGSQTDCKQLISQPLP